MGGCLGTQPERWSKNRCRPHSWLSRSRWEAPRRDPGPADRSSGSWRRPRPSAWPGCGRPAPQPRFARTAAHRFTFAKKVRSRRPVRGGSCAEPRSDRARSAVRPVSRRPAAVARPSAPQPGQQPPTLLRVEPRGPLSFEDRTTFMMTGSLGARGELSQLATL